MGQALHVAPLPADRLNPIANRPSAALRTFVRGTACGSRELVLLRL